MAKEPSQGTGNLIAEATLRGLAGILKEVGILNFLFLVLIIFFLKYSTDKQKEEFIDKWFLFKSDRYVFSIIVIVCILLLWLISTAYLTMMLQISRKENERVGKQKTELQQRLITDPLSTSEPKPQKKPKS